MQSDDTCADLVIREAMLAVSGVLLDSDKIAQVVAKVVDAVPKQAAALKQADYRPGDDERIARAMAHAMKSAGGLYRLAEFASGRPDSRSIRRWIGRADSRTRNSESSRAESRPTAAAHAHYGCLTSVSIVAPASCRSGVILTSLNTSRS
jgi:hypothetical protein